MILYIQTAFLGDLLLSVPTLKRLRKTYPNQEIHLICRKGLGEFFVREGLVDKSFDKFKGVKPSLGEVSDTFKNKKYEILICPHESIRSSLIAQRIDAKKKIGYWSALNYFVFDVTHPRPMKLPEALRQLWLLQDEDEELKQDLAEVETQSAPLESIPEWSSMTQLKYSDRLKYRERLIKRLSLSSDKSIIMLAPGSVWPTKRWGTAKFTELAQKLKDQNAEVILIGSPAEKDISSEIASHVRYLKDITGQTTVAELIEFIAGADLVVSNDSGAMHMASVTGTPTVAIFGPTVQRFGYQPWNTRAQVIENPDIHCRPCAAHGGRRCPLGTHECMTSIKTGEVLGTIDRLLSR